MAAAYTSRAVGEADVDYVGRIRARVPSPGSAKFQKHVLVLRPGYSIGHEDITAGTLGAFVSRGDDIYILSNSHVVANTNAGRKGDPVLQPGPLDGGRSSDDVAELADRIRLQRSSSNHVDAAIALLYDVRPYDHTTFGTQQLNGLGWKRPGRPREPVWKVGRTTGQTKGYVSAFGLDDVAVDYDGVTYTFDDQIEIVSPKGVFSDGGDSGSLIIDESNKAVALLFAGSNEGGPSDRGVTFANPIRTVLNALDVELMY